MPIRFGIIFSTDLSKSDKKKISDCNEKLKGKKSKLIEVSGVKYWLSKKEYSIYLKTKKSIKQTDINHLLQNRISVRLKKGKVSSRERNRLYNLAQKLSSHNSTLSRLMLINIYLELGFNGKVDSIINSIIKEEYINDFFRSEGMYTKQEEISKKVIKILKNIHEKFDDNKLFEILVSYLSYGVSPELRDLIVSEFDIPNKLSYVQDRVKSVNYAFMYPFVWTPWIEKYSSSVELELFLNKTNLYSYLKDGEYKYLSALRSSFPKTQQKRKVILNAYNNILKTKSPYLMDVKFRIHKNEDFIKYLIKEKVSTKPIFIEMRKFYRSEINKNSHLSYALYNLFMIGDLREEYFIKAMALRNNGL